MSFRPTDIGPGNCAGLSWPKQPSVSLRPPGGERDVLRKLITWAIVLFIIFYLATQPVSAANAVHNLFDGLKNIGNSLATFFNSL
jgi:hypothetical protein